MYTLSKRLKTIASLVPKGARVCDIGTDHAYLPIYLKQNGIADTVIASDINPLPLENARRNILNSGVEGIELRLCGGLSAISPDETDTVIIAGMGGEVISGIISDCVWLKTASVKLILQPTTSPEVLRRTLTTLGFEIKSETAVAENGKLYSVMEVYPGQKSLQMPEAFYYIGKINPHTADGRLYIEKQYTRLKKCADALKTVTEKHNEYLYFKSTAEDIAAVLQKA